VLGGLAAALLPAEAGAAALEEAAAAFAAGAAPAQGGITLTIPGIAEDGTSVPVTVEAPGAAAILILAAGNPQPRVAEVAFGPAAGAQRATTRIRLAQSQEVVALARFADGRVARTSAAVTVTVGGCTG
jgi:sulfur-oxidizing protein SoxY